MSPRTLRNWRQAALSPPARGPGRPRQPGPAWWAAARAVLGAVKEIGLVGWRTLHRYLQGRWSVSVVQRLLSALKARRRRRVASVRARTAQHVTVHGSGSVWSMDETHVGRTGDRRAVEGHVLKDNGSQKGLAAKAARPATGQDVVELLEAAKRREGGLAPVLLTDNGSPYTSRRVAEYLKAERVVHIRNLPHTPQHNAACERLNGELKEDSGLGKGTLIVSLEDTARLLEASRRRVNRRPRATLGWKSADERHQIAARRYTAATRERVHESCCRAMRDAMQGPGTVRARRLAARRAALDTLEQYGIISQSRGSDDRGAVKPEGIR